MAAKSNFVKPPVWTTAFSVLSLALVAFLSLMLAPAAAFYTLVTFAIFIIPGILLGPVLVGVAPGAWVERIIISLTVGIALSSYAAIVVGFAFGWSLEIIALTILGLSVVCGILGRKFRLNPLVKAPEKWDSVEYTILTGMLLVLVLFCALPYLNVGRLTSHGYGYTWLFGIDFLRRSDHVSAMMLKLPPDNLWMTGTPLRMYLVVYAIPAFAYALSKENASLHALILLDTLAVSILMVGCLYIFLRRFYRNKASLIWVGILAMVSYSYYWLYDLAKWIFTKPGQYSGFLTDSHFWYYESVSHLFQRTFLVEPTAALATALLLIMLFMLGGVNFKLNSFSLGVLLGMLLGISFGTDAMQGLVMVAWFGFFYLARFMTVKEAWREEAISFMGSVLVCGLVTGSFFLIGMYKLSTGQLVTWKFNHWVFLFGIGFFPVEFGPLLLLGVWGIVHWWRQNRPEFGWPLLFLAAIVLAQVAFVDQYPVPRTRIADRLLPIVFLVFSGFLIHSLWSSRSFLRARWIAICLALIGIPTLFTDVYYAADIGDEYQTRYVRVEDQRACDWIRHNLPGTAVIQGETDYFSGADHGHYLSLIASFAARPQVLGWLSESVAPVEKGRPIGEARLKDIMGMLNSTDVPSVLQVVQKYSINYLYVGPFEQDRHKSLLPLLQSASDDFREVYSANGVHIFQPLYNENAHPNLSSLKR